MKQIIHVIPVGGNEPIHSACSNCFCFPLEEKGKLIHNAKDIRESRERFGNEISGESWVLIYGFN